MNYQTRQQLKYAALQYLGKLRNRQPEDALLICSDPRGGSTWLMELLVEAIKPAVVWEPLHKNQGVADPALNLEWHPFAPADQTWPALRDDMAAILAARKLNSWCAQHPYGRYATSKHVLVKFVRANALLPWLTSTFAFRHKPIHLVRHPAAFAASAMRYFQGIDRDWCIAPVTDQRLELMPAGSDPEYVTRLTGLEERLVAQWCLHNLYTLRHPRQNLDWISVNYEHLLLDPASQLDRIETEWKITLPREVLSHADRESRTNFDFEPDKTAQLSKWRKHFDDPAIARMQAVLDAFGVDEYHLDSDLPQAVKPAQ